MRFGWHFVLTRDTDGRVADSARLWDIFQAYANRVVGPADSVELMFTQGRTLSTQKLMAMLNTVTLVGDVLAAEARGLEGVMLAASVDPALDEARSVARIAVVGSIESALALCGFVGRRAGIVTIAGGDGTQSYARGIEQNAVKYGCRDRLIDVRPVRATRQSWKEFYASYSDAVSGKGDALLTAFDATARELVADGADVIICGNQLFGAVLDHYGQLKQTSNGVPILCNGAAGLRMLQTLTSLHASVGLDVGRGGDFRSPGAARERLAPLFAELSRTIVAQIG